MTFM